MTSLGAPAAEPSAEGGDLLLNGCLVPWGYCADGELFNERLVVWVDGEGLHFLQW